MSKHELHSLLDSLQHLLHRIASLNLTQRLTSYQKSGTAAPHDISGTLSSHIEKLAGSAVMKEVNINQESPDKAQVSEGSDVVTSERGERKKFVHDLEPSGVLTESFEKHRQDLYSSNLSEKLQKSVREHIGISLNQARNGNLDGAKLHADLAKNALLELSHHMPAESYGEFSGNLERQLAELNNLAS